MNLADPTQPTCSDCGGIMRPCCNGTHFICANCGNVVGERQAPRATKAREPKEPAPVRILSDSLFLVLTPDQRPLLDSISSRQQIAWARVNYRTTVEIAKAERAGWTCVPCRLVTR